MQRLLFQARHIRSETSDKEKNYNKSLLLGKTGSHGDIQSHGTSEHTDTVQIPANAQWINLFKKRGPKLVHGQLLNASSLKKHIVILGNALKIERILKNIFINDCFKTDDVVVLYVNQDPFDDWGSIHTKYPNAFFMQLDVVGNPDAFELINIKQATSVIFLSSDREELEFENVENADFENLFLFLQIYPQLPTDVHYVVELTSGQNMNVLNSVAVRQQLKHTFLSRIRGANDCEHYDVVDNTLSESNIDKSQKFYFRKGMFSSQYIPSLDRGYFKGREILSQQNANRKDLRKSLSLKEEMKLYRKDMDDETNKFRSSNNADNDHFLLPIYASGRAFVPDVVENLLCQVCIDYT